MHPTGFEPRSPDHHRTVLALRASGLRQSFSPHKSWEWVTIDGGIWSSYNPVDEAEDAAGVWCASSVGLLGHNVTCCDLERGQRRGEDHGTPKRLRHTAESEDDWLNSATLFLLPKPP